jgi:TatD DNase family protein
VNSSVGPLVDTHAHIDASGGTSSLAPPEPGRTTAVIGVTNLPRHYVRLRTIRHERIRWALGMHPAQPHPPEAVDEFLDLAPDCDAIGEIGLDGTPADSPHAVTMTRQRDEFERILAHPAAQSRVVSIHSRRAVPAVVEHLQRTPVPGAVLHWFAGTPRQARSAAETGAFFSVNRRMLRNRDLIEALPRDRVLLETDAPHAGKTVRPGQVWPVLEALAAVWDIAAEAAEDQVRANQAALPGRLWT